MDKLLKRIKNCWKSRTIIFSGLLAVLGAAQMALPDLRNSVSAEAYGWITMAIAVAVAWLRFITTKDVADK